MADKPAPDAVPTDVAASPAVDATPKAAKTADAPAGPQAPDASSSSSAMPSASKITSMLKANSMTIIVGLICVAAGAFIVAYVLYWLINKSLISKKGITLPNTKVPIVATQLTKISGVSSPVSSNGKRFSMCFWIYVHDIDKYRGSTRHVFHIGDDSASSASPVVFFDSDSNKLLIGFSPINPLADPNFPGISMDPTTKKTGTGAINVTAKSQTDIITYLATKYGITIDYIPIQRWVHVCVVINEESSGGTMSAYVDGDLVKVMTTGNKSVYANKYSEVSTIQNINLSRAGSLIVGGSTSDPVGPGFSGLVSNIRLFNYDLNINDIYYEYRRGPIDNILARLGLPAYGVRSPVYKL